MREICSLSLPENTQIGGVNTIIEIDETHLHTRKYSRGRILAKEREQIWVFGGVERQSKKCFIVIVKNRSADVLIPIIAKYIKPGSTIISDQWKAYAKLSDIGFFHHTVNHSKNFINPEADWIHTQTIERL